MDDLYSVMIGMYEELDDSQTTYSDKDNIAMAILVIQYLEHVGLTQEKILYYMNDFYTWMQDEHPHIAEFILNGL